MLVTKYSDVKPSGCVTATSISFHGMICSRPATVHSIAATNSYFMDLKRYFCLTCGGVFIGGPWSLSALEKCTINKTGSDDAAPAHSTTSMKASEEGMIPPYSPISGLVKTPRDSGLTRFST